MKQNKGITVLIVSEWLGGKSLQFHFSHPMIAALLTVWLMIVGMVTIIIADVIDMAKSDKLLQENLLLNAQINELKLNITEMERQLELLQMYALQGTGTMGDGPWDKDDIWGAEETWSMGIDERYSSTDIPTEPLLKRLTVVRQRAELLYLPLLRNAERSDGLREKYSSIPRAWPADGLLTSRFGYRRSPMTGVQQFHRGIDIAAPKNTPIYAPGAGVVTLSQYVTGYGNLVELDHGNGVITRYAHNSSLKVQTGQLVNKGDLIALIGSTGRSTGPHLHYEIRIDGVAVDPINYLPERR